MTWNVDSEKGGDNNILPMKDRKKKILWSADSSAGLFTHNTIYVSLLVSGCQGYVGNVWGVQWTCVSVKKWFWINLKKDNLNRPIIIDFLTYAHVEIAKSSARTPCCFRSLMALSISRCFCFTFSSSGMSICRRSLGVNISPVWNIW